MKGPEPGKSIKDHKGFFGAGKRSAVLPHTKPAAYRQADLKTNFIKGNYRNDTYDRRTD